MVTHTPDGQLMAPRNTICTCAVHCTNSPYHEKACCERGWCPCWCHEKKYTEMKEAQAKGNFHPAT